MALHYSTAHFVLFCRREKSNTAGIEDENAYSEIPHDKGISRDEGEMVEKEEIVRQNGDIYMY